MRYLLFFLLVQCAHRGGPPADDSMLGRRACMKEMEDVHSVADFIAMGRRRRAAGEQAKDPGEKTRDLRCSLAAFQAANMLEPEDPAPHLASAEIYLGFRALKDAALEYHRTLELAPETPGANLRLAQLARNEGDLPEALAYLREEKRVNPHGYEAWVEQGNLEMSTRNFLGAETQFTHAHRLAPANRDALFGRALARNLLGNFSAAERDLNTVVKTDPDFPDAYWQLGLLHEKMRKNAIGDYRKFRALLDPASPMAAQVEQKIQALSR